MVKIIGVIIVAVASWGYGSHLIYRLNQHRDQLFSIREMVDFFLGEIQYGKVPLQEACMMVGDRLPQPFKETLYAISEELSKNHYQSFEAIWREQFLIKEKELYLIEQELTLLYGIGKNLGVLDIEAQLRHLQLYRNQIDEVLEQQQKTMREKKKVYRSVSLMVGVMVILLFV